MALRVKKLFENNNFEVVADKGYYKTKDLKKCTENGIAVYITKQTYANGTKDPVFYSDQFKYDSTKNVYLFQLERNSIIIGLGRKMERSLAMNTTMMMPVKIVN